MWDDKELVEFEGRWYLVWREYKDKGSDYLFSDLNAGIADKELIEAFFEKKYEGFDDE